MKNVREEPAESLEEPTEELPEELLETVVGGLSPEAAEARLTYLRNLLEEGEVSTPPEFVKTG